MATTETLSKEAFEEDDEHYVDAEEKGLLSEEPPMATPKLDRTGLSSKFWLSAGVNTASTAAIVSRCNSITRQLTYRATRSS